MCQNGAASSLHYWVDSGSIAAQYGLSKWIWINQYHSFRNMLTYNSHKCDSIVTRNWFIVQNDSPSVMHCLSPELAYLKQCNTRDSLSRNRCEWQCIAIVILMFSRPWVIPKIENCRNANFVITVIPAIVIIMTTWVMTMLASWRLSVFSAMTYQILGQYSLIPRYYLW